MKGRLQKDYVYVAGIQYIITTVVENGYYGRCTGTAAQGGLVLLKQGNLLVLAAFTEPATAAQAVPFVHRFAQDI